MKFERFFHRGVNYSACNEDARSEYEAFSLSGDENVLCIGGGGERLFNLLAYETAARRYVVVDASRDQLALFALKRAAFDVLDHPELSRFLGLEACDGGERLRLLRAVEPALPEADRTYWQSRTRIVRDGVIYHGRFERFTALMGNILRLFYGNTFTDLFACRSLDEQQRFFEERIAGWRWNMLLSILCRKIWFRLLTGDPAFYAYEQAGDYAVHFKRELERGILSSQVHENFLLALVLSGGYVPKEGTVPACYLPEHHARIRERLRAVEIVTVHAPLTDYLSRADSEAFDCYSLSDLPSYLDQAQMRELLEAVARRARPGARIVIRELLTRYDFDPLVPAAVLRRDRSLEGALESARHNFIWRFVVLRRDPEPTVTTSPERTPARSLAE